LKAVVATPDPINHRDHEHHDHDHDQLRQVPQRTCLGCRRVLPQHSLVRCAIGPDGARVSRTAAGRGAWLCSLECFDLAAKRRGFERAWKRSVDADALATLRIAFEGVITNMTELLVVGSRPDRPALMKG
jgi:predicted RNA-binding protein YlxR (DUF448 family)